MIDFPTIQDLMSFDEKIWNLKIDLPEIGTYPMGGGLLDSTSDEELSKKREKYQERASELTNYGMDILFNKQAAKELIESDICKWAGSNVYIKEAFKSFQRKGRYKEYKKNGADELIYLEFVSIAMMMIDIYKKKSASNIPVLTKPARTKALKNAEKLVLSIREGVGLMDLRKNIQLKECLDDLIYELENNAPTLISKSNSGYLLERAFAQQTALMFYVKFHDYCTTVVGHLIGIISDKAITHDALVKWIEDVKAFQAEKQNVKRPNPFQLPRS